MIAAAANATPVTRAIVKFSPRNIKPNTPATAKFIANIGARSTPVPGLKLCSKR